MRHSSRYFLLSCLVAGSVSAVELVVPMDLISERGIGKRIGAVSIADSPYGLVFTPTLENLPAGAHGFHVHEHPSCLPEDKDGKPVAGLAAGGHYDPEGSKRHDTPWGDGHLGDLPVLVVDPDGKSTYPVLAPRLKLKDVKNRALIIHAGSDNYSDIPEPLGGGGARIACGVIKD